jgi:hypothetical protein
MDELGANAWVARRQQLNRASMSELENLFEQEIPIETRPDSYLRTLGYASRAQALRFCLGSGDVGTMLLSGCGCG